MSDQLEFFWHGFLAVFLWFSVAAFASLDEWLVSGIFAVFASTMTMITGFSAYQLVIGHK